MPRRSLPAIGALVVDRPAGRIPQIASALVWSVVVTLIPTLVANTAMLAMSGRRIYLFGPRGWIGMSSGGWLV